MTATTPVAPKPTDKDAPQYTNRRAKIAVGPATLHAMFDVPDGFRIVAVQPTRDHNAVEVVVESDSLPDRPWDCELPYIGGSWTTYGVVVRENEDDEDGTLYQRFGWQPEAVK